MESDRMRAVGALLFDYVKSPSLAHLRAPHSVWRLAEAIVQAVDRGGSVWTKWDGARDEVLNAASTCWIPIEDLQAGLNLLPGPSLTITDVAQRLRARWEAPYQSYPNEDIRAGCEALYAAEKAAGTELRAIIGALQAFVEDEEIRLHREREAAYLKARADERVRQQQRFLAGADCGWTAMDGRADLFCRKNGRTFRISQGKDKRWTLYRIGSIDDAGAAVGVYLSRTDANKALRKIAYEPEPQW